MASTRDSNPISTPPSTTTCHLLSIPPEIRNRIYDMCFAPASRKVNLLEAEPPSKDLLLTCKQICEETKLMRRKAYRDFWTTSTFEIVKPMNARLVQERDTSKNIENINEDDFRHIKRMNVMTPHNA